MRIYTNKLLVVIFIAAMGCTQNGTDSGYPVFGNDTDGGFHGSTDISSALSDDVAGNPDDIMSDQQTPVADISEAVGTDISTREAGLCQPSDLEKVNPGRVLTVPDEHRTCETVDDCAAIYIECSACEGGCAGVHSTCADAYGALLDCSGYVGPVCDYDCHPKFNLTSLECVQGLCTVVE